MFRGANNDLRVKRGLAPKAARLVFHWKQLSSQLLVPAPFSQRTNRVRVVRVLFESL